MEKCKCCKNEHKDDKTIIAALQEEMANNGYVSVDAIKRISKELNKPVSEVYGVVTFYSQFSFKPKAKYTIDICTGTACFILGGEEIVNALVEELGVQPFENTPDGKFCIQTVRCIGCCGMAPVMSINGKVYGNLTAKSTLEIIKGLE